MSEHHCRRDLEDCVECEKLDERVKIQHLAVESLGILLEPRLFYYCGFHEWLSKFQDMSFVMYNAWYGRAIHITAPSERAMTLEMLIRGRLAGE